MSKKIRGKGRKLRKFYNFPETFKTFFPKRDFKRGYWKYLIPIDQGLIDEKQIKKKYRKKIAKTILKALQILMDNRTKSSGFLKIIAIINSSDLFYSELTVFFSGECYKNFWKRNSEYQKWKTLPKKKSLLKEWSITGFENLEEKGFLEKIKDENFSQENELWVYGDLP